MYTRRTKEVIRKWIRTYQMERMRSLIKIINHKINPNRFRARRERKLIPVPFLPGKARQRDRRILLWAPGGAVEKSVRDVVVDG